MEPIYANVVLRAVFLFLGTIGYGEIVVRMLNRAEFKDFGWSATPAGLDSLAVVGFWCAIWAFYLQSEASYEAVIQIRLEF